MRMIKGWVLQGVVDDPFHEFFIELNEKITNEFLWYEKYKLRNEMMVSFFTPDFHEKVNKYTTYNTHTHTHTHTHTRQQQQQQDNNKTTTNLDTLNWKIDQFSPQLL
jgi:hypothetical protein